MLQATGYTRPFSYQSGDSETIKGSVPPVFHNVMYNNIMVHSPGGTVPVGMGTPLEREHITCPDMEVEIADTW